MGFRKIESKKSGERFYRMTIPNSWDELLVSIYDRDSPNRDGTTRDSQEVDISLSVAGEGIYPVLKVSKGICCSEFLDSGRIPTFFGPIFYGTVNLLDLIEQNLNGTEPEDSKILTEIVKLVWSKNSKKSD